MRKPTTDEAALLKLIQKALDVLRRQIVPDGISDHQALNELHAIFDGPKYRAILEKFEGEEISRDRSE